MRVLVLGANGFLGGAIVTALRRAEIDVRAGVRQPEPLRRRFPDIEAFAVDLTDPDCHAPDFWHDRLEGIAAVINAAGVLQPRRADDAWAVHQRAPAALFTACETHGVRRLIQISAIGVDEADTNFARSKRAGDKDLMRRDLDWTVLRPAIVVGDGSYGGTSLLRALAAAPFLTPVPGDGNTPIDTIHKDDLAAAIVAMLQDGRNVGAILEPASPQRLSLREAVRAYRRWLGLAPAPVLALPMPLVRLFGRIGDVMRLDPITSTSVAQFEARLTGDPSGFAEARGLDAVLAARPAESQDLWHARLTLLRPLVRLALILLWLGSGIAGLAGDPFEIAGLLSSATRNLFAVAWFSAGFSLLDLGIAVALFVAWRPATLANLQFVVVLGYTVLMSALAPELWLDLTGGLLKNIPILALILVHRVLEQER